MGSAVHVLPTKHVYAEMKFRCATCGEEVIDQWEDLGQTFETISQVPPPDGVPLFCDRPSCKVTPKVSLPEEK